MSDRLEEIKARVEAATPGPWVTNYLLPESGDKALTAILSSDINSPLVVGSTLSDADGDFVCHAREDIPYLLAEIESLRGAPVVAPEPCHDTHRYTSMCEYHRGFKDGADSIINRLSTAPVVAGELTPKTVFDEVKAELARAQAKFPDEHLPNFPERMDWDHAAAERDQAQELTDRCHASGVVTWWHVLREEIYEAFAESDPAKLRAELVQVAAMAIRWIEDLESAPVEGESK